MLNPAPARKLSANIAMKDLEIEKSRTDIEVNMIPPRIMRRSLTLPEASEAGYDRAAYPMGRAPTSKPTS